MCEGVSKECQDPWRSMSLRRHLPWIGVGEGWGWADQVEGTALAKASRMKIPPENPAGAAEWTARGKCWGGPWGHTVVLFLETRDRPSFSSMKVLP